MLESVLQYNGLQHISTLVIQGSAITLICVHLLHLQAK